LTQIFFIGGRFPPALHNVQKGSNVDGTSGTFSNGAKGSLDDPRRPIPPGKLLKSLLKSSGKLLGSVHGLVVDQCLNMDPELFLFSKGQGGKPSRLTAFRTGMNLTLLLTCAASCAEVMALAWKEIVGALIAMEIHGCSLSSLSRFQFFCTFMHF
jgi:hypothetical protein